MAGAMVVVAVVVFTEVALAVAGLLGGPLVQPCPSAARTAGQRDREIRHRADPRKPPDLSNDFHGPPPGVEGHPSGPGSIRAHAPAISEQRLLAHR